MRAVALGVLLFSLALSSWASQIPLYLQQQQQDDDIRGHVTEIFDGIHSAADCSGCETVLALAKAAARLGDGLFVRIFTEICKLSKAEDDDVCSGTIALEGPIVAQVLRQMEVPSRTSQMFCNTISGLCGFPPVNPPSLNLSSKPANASRPRTSGQTPLQIVQYSDIHVDPFYVTGSDANCTKPICCRDYDSSSGSSSTFSPAGAFGDHKCDTPRTLEQSMYSAIGKVAPNANFVLFTGDIVDHAVWNTTQEQNSLEIEDAHELMAGLKVNVYGTIGNHEPSPVNAIQPNIMGNTTQWVYDLLSSAWTQWIGPEAALQEEDGGYYSTHVPNTNLRIISLNTNFYYKFNFWLYHNPLAIDPNGQLAWLINELSEAEAANERVYIIGHMPIGSTDSFYDGSNGLDQIVNRYSDTIAGMFFGHTHKDEFEITYANYSARSYSSAAAFSYIMPSLTPTDGMPAFRVYTVDPVTWAVLDAETYIANMSSADFQAEPMWTKYYSAKEVYGTLVSPKPGPDDELSPAFWHNVTEAFKTNGSAFDEFWAKRTRGWNVMQCEGTCRTDAICELQAARAQDNCYTSLGGVHFSSQDDKANAAHSHEAQTIDCGQSIFRKIFARLNGPSQNWRVQ